MISVYKIFEQIIDAPDSKFKIVPDLVRWAKKQNLMDKEKQSPQKPDLKPGEYAIPKKIKTIRKLLNRKSGRMKNKKITQYYITKIKPENRTLRNRPRYANKKVLVRFQDWLLMKNLPGKIGVAKSLANDKWYGWSHRAIYGFGVGQTVKIDSMGNYKKPKKEWVIKTDDEAKRCAIKFSDEVS